MTSVNRKSITAVSVLLLGLANTCAIAAPYFVSYTSLAVGTCTTTSIIGSVSGSESLAPPPNNLVATISVNSGPSSTIFYSVTPPIQTGALTFNFSIPSTSLPYTINGTGFPAAIGAPVGTGVSLTFMCDAQGTLTSTSPQSIPAPINSVPTLNNWSTALLSGLLILGVWMKRQRS
jgi:hypothetical protein